MTRSVAFPLVLACLLALFPGPAWGQSRSPSLETSVSARDVEVGRSFSLQLSAMVSVSDRVPSNPALQVPSGVVIRSGPTVMPKTHVTLHGPNLIQQMGVVVTWTLEATRAGRHQVGPPSVMWAGQRHVGSKADIVAHAQGTLPRPRSRDPFDLFDIFGLPKLPGIFDEPSFPFGEPLLPPTDPALAMTNAPDQVVFLRALVDRKAVVIGQQVTLSVYEYFHGASLRKTSLHEASAPDFLQIPVLDPSDDPGIRHADVGSSIWKARLLRRVALFPLRTGTLTVTPMRVSYQGRGLRGQEERRTKPIAVTVTEAPTAGRPVGFRSGDVGSFSLRAQVEPREVDAGGAVSVQVRLHGKGNLPTTLPTPSGKGIEWLDPDVREDLEAVDGQIQGERVFSYVVRLREPGTVKLGEIRLPYYDPQRRRYAVTRVDLGSVVVRENPELEETRAVVDRFAELGGPRPMLGPVPRKTVPLTDHRAYWIVLFASPISIVLFGAGLSLARRMNKKVRSWKGSSDRQVKGTFREAAKAVAEGRIPDAAASVERAVHTMIEASTGLKSRGVLRSDLHDRLVEQGVSSEVARRIVGVFETCETIRFDPSSKPEQIEVLLGEARALKTTLGKSRKRSV